jgi:predicted amidohydrolase
VPGSSAYLLQAGGFGLGMSICYDLRFPELYRQLWRAGADALLVPAAFTAHTGRAHWHILLRARAIENQSYVIAAAQHGQHNEKRETFGHSLAIDPWGRILAEHPEGEGVVLATLDRAVLAETRRNMPCSAHAVTLATPAPVTTIPVTLPS